MRQFVYSFEEGNAGMKDVLGGKGANLAEMTRLGLPVPPGLTISAEACIEYYNQGKKIPGGVMESVKEKLAKVEEKTGKKFGSGENPLLVSVRSGARASMPGMMDTVLNLGMNDDTAKTVAEKTGNERFAFDSYRRFLQMFGNVVLGIEHEKFEEKLAKIKESKGAKLDTELDAPALEKLIGEYKALIEKETGKPFPQDAWEQLECAVGAVFWSWNNQRAKTYRKINKIPDEWGTAVNIQAMVFGNMGNGCATGVAFTRNPSTGEKKVYGEYLINAQGEDVVAGIRTPKEIEELGKEMPEAYAQFAETCTLLENHFKEMQDMEFTIENKKLYLLQTRNGKRTGKASVKIAVDMQKEGIITKEDALMKVNPHDLNQLLHKQIDEKASIETLATGLAASPGAASGQAVFDADSAEQKAKDMKVILVRPETTPDDIHGMVAAQGVLTARGGMTSHAAVVARGMGKPCVSGCESIKVDAKQKLFSIGGKTVKEGDWISIDGTTGKVFLGQAPLVEPKIDEDFRTILQWADETARLGVRTNAETPRDAKKAFELGAKGIGLCRTEHMFFEQNRLPIMQKMIMSGSEGERRKHLNELLEFQRKDFEELFGAMQGNPVTIRLIDPPLHEFLPQREELMVEVAKMNAEGKDAGEKEKLLSVVNELHEQNPMLGLRGCRLAIVYPEIVEMQTRAIMQAALNTKKKGTPVKPEIMVPLVSHTNELREVKQKIEETIKEEFEKAGEEAEYTVGTTIELPRAALTAGEIAKEAEFFSFGTNDLTQTTFGFSRDDAEPKFLGHYMDKKILPVSPFVTLDSEGVGRLVEIAVKEGREARKGLKCGICGEHGGDPESIEFCHKAGLDYVSCSPFRVPIARLSAAQAKIRHK